MTVTIFTGLFLVCNMPYFMYIVLYALDEALSNYDYPGPLFQNSFMYWYSWTISRVLFTVLNATLNPVVYYYRVPGLRGWVCRLVRARRRGTLRLGERVLRRRGAITSLLAD